MKRLFFSILVLLTVFSIAAQESSPPSSISPLDKDSVKTNILRQLLSFPQEKIYIQTDKPYYISGEKIYFRTFLLNALSNKLSIFSRYVYVELLNPIDSVIIRKQIRPDDNNLFYGELTLPEDIPQGFYRIRAYTRFMTNLPEDYFYFQNIYIADPTVLHRNVELNCENLNNKTCEVNLRLIDSQTGSVYSPERLTFRLENGKKESTRPDAEGWFQMKLNLSPEDVRRSLLMEWKEDGTSLKQYVELPFPKKSLNLQFFPEGGNLISDKMSTIVFKANNISGNPTETEIRVMDANNNQIITAQTFHEGMGSFSFIPEKEAQYYALATYNGQEFRFDLPSIHKNVCSLKAVWEEDKLSVAVNKTDDFSYGDLFLLVHSRGIVSYYEKWDPNNESILLNKADLISGVSHILLMDAEFRPLSERLVFLWKDDMLSADITTNKKTYKSREKANIGVQLENFPNDTINADFSLSITDDKDIRLDTTRSILTTILLTSELQGTIDNPAFYFQTGDTARKAADLLMMTNGWRRYDFPRALRGDYQIWNVRNEISQSLSGIVKGGFLWRPYKGATVKILSIKNFFYDAILTDEDGRFSFTHLEFPDSTQFVIQALSSKGGHDLEVEMDKAQWPEVNRLAIHQSDFVNKMTDDLGFEAFIEKAELKYTYENGMRMIYLPDITIKGKTKKTSKYKTEYGLIPNYSISEEQINEMQGMDIGSMLLQLPGVEYLAGSSITVTRGEGTAAPLIMVNGLYLNMGPEDMEGALQALEMLNTSDLGQINIYRDASDLVMYGPRGSGGVIEIHTKSGTINRSGKSYNTVPTTPLGYQTPTEFYSPRYDTPEQLKSSIPDLRSTIYWKPDVITDKTGKATVEFYTADTPSTYSLILEGVSSNGELIYQKEKEVISVKK